MSRRTGGLLLLLLASEALGIALGQWFYDLYIKTVPPMAISSFNLGASHAFFLMYGAASGLPIFALALLAVYASRYFTGPAPATAL